MHNIRKLEGRKRETRRSIRKAKKGGIREPEATLKRT